MILFTLYMTVNPFFIKYINAFRRRLKYIRQQSLLILPCKVGEHISGGTEEPPHYVIT